MPFITSWEVKTASLLRDTNNGNERDDNKRNNNGNSVDFCFPCCSETGVFLSNGTACLTYKGCNECLLKVPVERCDWQGFVSLNRTVKALEGARVGDKNPCTVLVQCISIQCQKKKKSQEFPLRHLLYPLSRGATSFSSLLNWGPTLGWT